MYDDMCTNENIDTLDTFIHAITSTNALSLLLFDN